MRNKHTNCDLHKDIKTITQTIFDDKANLYMNEDKISEFLDHKNKEMGSYEIQLRHEKLQYSVKFAKLCISNQLKALMIVITDISARLKHQETMISEKMKTIMICSISHEIRSPLNQINGCLSLLQPTLQRPEQLKFIKIANSSSEILRMKIDDILNYYEVETKTFKPNFTNFDIRENCKLLESLFLQVMNVNLVKLRFFVDSSTPKYIYHDISRIRGILANFIGNSIKYTKKGVISVIIDWIEGDINKVESKPTLKFMVSDSGCGISEKKKLTLFKFLDPNLCDEFEIDCGSEQTTPLAGTGLGISQKIAIQLGTAINFKSTEGNGSSFWFELQIDEFINSSEDSDDNSSVSKLNLSKKLYEVDPTSSPLNSARQSKGKETKFENQSKLLQSISHIDNFKNK